MIKFMIATQIYSVKQTFVMAYDDVTLQKEQNGIDTFGTLEVQLDKNTSIMSRAGQKGGKTTGGCSFTQTSVNT